MCFSFKNVSFLFVLRNKQTRNKQADFQTCAQTLDSGWLELVVGGDLIGPYEDTSVHVAKR